VDVAAVRLFVMAVAGWWADQRQETVAYLVEENRILSAHLWLVGHYGHTKVDTTMNVYTQVLDGAAREAADRVGSELFRIVQNSGGTTALIHWKDWLAALDDFRNWLIREAA
jgi:hypothetical protein